MDTRKRLLSRLFLLGALLCTFPAVARAQAAATAIRKVGIDVFAAGAVSSTDYGSTDRGFVLGGDFTRHLRLFDPSLTVRFNKVTGSTVGEKSFNGGLKVERAFGRFHPYAQFLVGYGVITFNNPTRNPDGSLYTYDDSIVYDAGAGIDIDLTRRFALKVDGQYQHWKLGQVTTPIVLTPALASVGLVYRIPYRFLRPRRY